MLTVRNIFKRYGPVKVLLGVGFSISKGQKVALVGQNGVGKSTLLRILAGIEVEDKGSVERAKGLQVAYLPQEYVVESQDETVLDFFRRVSGIAGIEGRMVELEHRLDSEGAMERYGELRDRHEALGGFSFDRKARRALDGLALKDIPLDRKAAELSGGQRRRAALAGVLLSEADLLLLDEPTNDLDLPAILWLESFVRDSASAVIVASHDRAFLDAVSEKVLELDWHFRTAKMWTGNYSTYFREKSEELRREREEHERTETERERLRETAEEKKEWARLGGEYKMPDKDRMSQGFHRDRSQQKQGARARALFTRSWKVKKVELHPERDPLSIYFEPRSGEDAEVAVEGAVSGYDSFRVGPVDMKIAPGLRIGIFGRNGSGKSTFLRMLAGELPLRSGSIRKGGNVSFGIISQGNDIVPREKTALEWFARETPIGDEVESRRYLSKFLLNVSATEFPMGDLSPGERMRLSVAFLMATGINVLILDEPTNHLDLEAVEALESALDLYPGTIILVSHDRVFLERFRFSQVWSVEAGAFSREKDYGSYLEKTLSEAKQSLGGRASK